jgi:hypothetical protein
LLEKSQLPGVVVHISNSRSQEAEAEELIVQGQPGYIVRTCLKRKKKTLCFQFISHNKPKTLNPKQTLATLIYKEQLYLGDFMSQ